MGGIEIIVVGREILMGTTQDSNSAWLAREISLLGARVTRFTAVDDDIKEIAGSIKEALKRGAGCIISTGGLGPTFDDLTLKGVADATGHELSLHQGALNFIKRRYRHLHRQGYVDSPEMNPAREKMAHLPLGAEFLRNPLGTAPGTCLRYKGSVIVALPGVPAEMKGIFGGSVKKILRELFAGGYLWQTRIRSGVGDESKMAETIEGLVGDYQDVHIKSRPETFGPVTSIEIEITAVGGTRGEARRRGEMVERKLRKLLKSIGGGRSS